MSVMPNSVRPHRRQPTRLRHPWDSPGKNTGVGCHFLLQCMQRKSESEVAQSCLTQRPRGLKPTRLLRPWDFPELQIKELKIELHTGTVGVNNEQKDTKRPKNKTKNKTQLLLWGSRSKNRGSGVKSRLPPMSMPLAFNTNQRNGQTP